MTSANARWVWGLRPELPQLGEALAICLLCSSIVVDAQNALRFIKACGCFANANEKILGLSGLLCGLNLEVYSRSRAPSQQLAPPVSVTSNKP
jgi:hypothetical protein